MRIHFSPFLLALALFASGYCGAADSVDCQAFLAIGAWIRDSLDERQELLTHDVLSAIEDHEQGQEIKRLIEGAWDTPEDYASIRLVLGRPGIFHTLSNVAGHADRLRGAEAPTSTPRRKGTLDTLLSRLKWPAAVAAIVLYQDGLNLLVEGASLDRYEMLPLTAARSAGWLIGAASVTYGLRKLGLPVLTEKVKSQMSALSAFGVVGSGALSAATPHGGLFLHNFLLDFLLSYYSAYWILGAGEASPASETPVLPEHTPSVARDLRVDALAYRTPNIHFWRAEASGQWYDTLVLLGRGRSGQIYLLSVARLVSGTSQE